MRRPHHAQINLLRLCSALYKASPGRSSLFAALSLSALCVMSACEDERPPNEQPDAVLPTAGESAAGAAVAGDAVAGDAVSCVPDCEGRACGVDPRCGQPCGECGDTQRCEAAQCVPDLSAGSEAGGQAGAQAGAQAGTQAQTPTAGEGCADSCEALGAECGEACGVSCGTCAEGSACEGHTCVCTPQCAGRSCGDDNGCGGTCSPCPRTESCEGCVLRLRVLSFEERGGVVSGARIALSLQLPEDAVHPEIADVHLNITGPAIIGRVGLGDVVANAGKQLVPNPATGLPYRAEDSRYSFMIMSTQNTSEIPSGDWLIIDLMLGDTSASPVQVSFIQREQTFAPPPADLQLWGAEFGEPLVIWPALSQGE